MSIASRPRLLALLTVLFGLGLRAAQAGPVVFGVDLDAYDAAKRLAALPNGEHLAYLERGAAAGPPVVLIHGYTDNARDWVPVVPYLGEHHRLIVVDIRGHGLSSKPECCYSRYDFAYDIKLLLDHLRIARADIVGHSLGSMIAQTFAETWPERTRHLVLISSTAQPVQYDFTQIRQLHEPIDPDSPFMVQWWSSPHPVDEQFMRRQRRDSAQIPLAVWLAVLDQGLVDANLRASLPKLKAPTLLLWGSDDFIMQAADRDSLTKALPNAKVKIFEGLGHNPFWEQPAEVSRVIDEFLAAP